MDHPKHPKITGLSLAITATIVSTLAFSIASAESVATVNGVDIDNATFEFYLQNRIQMPPEQVTAEQRELVLQELKDIYLLATQPRAEELAKSPQLQAQIELQHRATLAQAVASDWLANHSPSDEEIQEAYSAQALLAPALQFKASHILVETQSAAADLIAQLDTGANFAELAKASSIGPSGPSGGELGWFSPNDMVTPFSDAVTALKDGEYTKSPVQTEFGWHVILRQESRKSEAPPLDSVRDAVKANVEQGNFQRYLEKLRAGDEG